MQTKMCHAEADTNADANRISTKNNMSPSPSVGDIMILSHNNWYNVCSGLKSFSTVFQTMTTVSGCDRELNAYFISAASLKYHTMVPQPVTLS